MTGPVQTFTVIGGFNRTEWVLTGIALVWSLLLPLGAIFVPLYGASVTSTDGDVTTGASLVGENGWWVMTYAVLPLVVTLIVAGLLWASHNLPGLRVVAWVLIAPLAAFNVMAMMTIGIFILPVTVLLVALAVVRSRRAAIAG